MVRLAITLAAQRGQAKGLTIAFRAVMSQALATRGCLGVHLCADLNNPDVLHYCERWPTELELRDRVRSRHFSHLIAVLEVAAAPPRIEIEFVSNTLGLEYIGDVLNRN